MSRLSHTSKQEMVHWDTSTRTMTKIQCQEFCQVMMMMMMMMMSM